MEEEKSMSEESPPPPPGSDEGAAEKGANATDEERGAGEEDRDAKMQGDNVREGENEGGGSDVEKGPGAKEELEHKGGEEDVEELKEGVAEDKEAEDSVAPQEQEAQEDGNDQEGGEVEVEAGGGEKAGDQGASASAEAAGAEDELATVQDADMGEQEGEGTREGQEAGREAGEKEDQSGGDVGTDAEEGNALSPEAVATEIPDKGSFKSNEGEKKGSSKDGEGGLKVDEESFTAREESGRRSKSSNISLKKEEGSKHQAEDGKNPEVQKRLDEVLARQRLLDEDRDNLEIQVQELRIRADLEGQKRQEAESAREAAEEELRYRSRVQGQTDGRTQKLINSLQMTVNDLQAQLADVQSQEGLVAELRERIDKAEAEMRDKGAQFAQVKGELERRLQQQQQLLIKNRSYLEGVGRRKMITSNALQSAVAELRGKRRETEEMSQGLEGLLRRMDQFVTEETSRIRGLTDIKDSVAGLKTGETHSVKTLEELDIQLRQERDGSMMDYQSQRRLEDELLMHLNPQPQGMHAGAMDPYGAGGHANMAQPEGMLIGMGMGGGMHGGGNMMMDAHRAGMAGLPPPLGGRGMGGAIGGGDMSVGMGMRGGGQPWGGGGWGGVGMGGVGEMDAGGGAGRGMDHISSVYGMRALDHSAGLADKNGAAPPSYNHEAVRRSDDMGGKRTPVKFPLIDDKDFNNQSPRRRADDKGNDGKLLGPRERRLKGQLAAELPAGKAGRGGVDKPVRGKGAVAPAGAVGRRVGR